MVSKNIPNIVLDSTSIQFKNKLSKNNFRVFVCSKNKDDKYTFPDGEAYVRLDQLSKIKGRTVIIHSGAPQASKGLIELEIILTILREKRVTPIEVLFTYFPYGQQDKSFLAGELNVAESILKKLVEFYKVSRILIVDPHFSYRPWLKKYPVKILSAFGYFKKFIEQRQPDLVLLSADRGQYKRTGVIGTKKKRINSYNVTFILDKKVINRIKGHHVCIIDDLVETGGTLIKLSEECRRKGAKKISVYVTHTVLTKGAQKIKAEIDDFYSTNSIKNRKFRINLADLIIKNLQ